MDRFLEGRLWVRSAMIMAVITFCGLVAMSCSNNSSPTAPSESSGDTLATTAAVGAPNLGEKTAICHFQKDLGTWKVTMLSPEAFASHLDKHDDAAPGEITAITGVLLDNRCKKKDQ